MAWSRGRHGLPYTAFLLKEFEYQEIIIVLALDAPSRYVLEALILNGYGSLL